MRLFSLTYMNGGEAPNSCEFPENFLVSLIPNPKFLVMKVLVAEMSYYQKLRGEASFTILRKIIGGIL